MTVKKMKSKLIISSLEQKKYFDSVFENIPTSKNKKTNGLINQKDIVKNYSKNGELHLILQDNNFRVNEIKMSMREEAKKPLLLKRI